LLAVPAWAYQKCRGREGLGAVIRFCWGDRGLGGVVGVVVIMLAASLLGLLLAIIWALSGRRVEASTILPLGSLMAVAAWPTCLAWPCCNCEHGESVKSRQSMRRMVESLFAIVGPVVVQCKINRL
jgi:hypothetical protein